jgi:SAM-dependent methyltransferase
MIDTAQRATGAELMDQPDQDERDLEVALRDLRAVNRWLGGWRVLRSRMADELRALPRGEYHVLDIGTGSGDLAVRLARWARGRGHRLRVLATDVHPTTLELARRHTAGEPDVEVGRADALALPFPDNAFDFAICSTTLHHFEGGEETRVLSEMSRVAARALIVNDLRRSTAGLLGARLLAATAWRRSRLTRHDGPLSVRRAFTAGELRATAARAGLRDPDVRTHSPFRVSLVARGGGGRSG